MYINKAKLKLNSLHWPASPRRTGNILNTSQLLGGVRVTLDEQFSISSFTSKTLPWLVGTTHWDMHEHQGYIKMVCSAQLYGCLSSLITSSLHNSIHPPEMEINPPKIAWGCPSGRAMIIFKSHTQSSHPVECNCQLHNPGDPQCA